jgi:hypothetical protein
MKPKSDRWPFWWRLVLVLLGYLLVARLGVVIVSPTGPGSDLPICVLLIGYSCVLVLIVKHVVLKLVTVCGIIIGMLGGYWCLCDRMRFVVKMNTRPHVRHVPVDGQGARIEKGSPLVATNEVDIAPPPTNPPTDGGNIGVKNIRGP